MCFETIAKEPLRAMALRTAMNDNGFHGVGLSLG
jgi:hypothetical protein